ncbi:MAG: hypothetical protein MZV64_72800 [Ignavibacteriales bacterium]|nr:hypothetical protein [Ignavibacteriales bacterium]
MAVRSNWFVLWMLTEPPAGPERVMLGAHDARDERVVGGVGNQPRHVVGRRHVGGQQAGRVDVARVLEAQFGGLLVHAGHEPCGAPRRDPSQHPRRRVV